MLKPNPTPDRALAVTGLVLGVGACAAVAVWFLLMTASLIAEPLLHDRRAAAIVMAGTALLISSPALAASAVVCGHISRRLYPTSAAPGWPLILGYAVLALIAMMAVLGAVTWLTIRPR